MNNKEQPDERSPMYLDGKGQWQVRDELSKIRSGNMLYKCSFCKAKIWSEKLPESWGKAKAKVGDKEIDLTFCPQHRKEAEEKLDIFFKKDARDS